ncbi:hypothetical protein ACVH9Z_21335 [Rhodococcus opacus]|uniref:Uncharacterized protein n=2 Tax=Rhodococcus opacus TaxID=37919 RepID=A0AAX3Y9D0_RHOOP|nr:MULTISPECIES: hypothetical protein [Rhodococcus]MCZ4589752.1 hypothetical protein [Rhodococcus opacus]MDI9941108.1 hypothetical protein [Rhodococcus sp. IEGM 1351]MDJ0418006.1 hypothetical protein [Rhodococcus opacus]MDV6247963.1 hypothetical protein [Rhodococcus opacus]UNN01231.1 hypothetical protein MOO23_01420 [Rhodococcus opacus]
MAGAAPGSVRDGHHPAVATRQIIAALVSAGRVRRAWLRIAGMQVPLPPKLQGRIGSKTGL